MHITDRPNYVQVSVAVMLEFSFSAQHADVKLCVFVYTAALGGTVWEKLLSTVAIDEGEIRVLSGLGLACMKTLYLCENFFFAFLRSLHHRDSRKVS